MKRIDIESRKKLHKTAKKILNCILMAKRRIEQQEDHIKMWKNEFFYSPGMCERHIEAHKAAIVRLEQRYTKLISQL